MPHMARRRKPLPNIPGNPWPEVLFALREAAGWEQIEAAAEIGTTRRTWGRWENGVLVPVGPSAYALRCLIRAKAPSLLKKLRTK